MKGNEFNMLTVKSVGRWNKQFTMVGDINSRIVTFKKPGNQVKQVICGMMIVMKILF